MQENDDPVLPANIEEEYDDNDGPDMKFQLDPITSQMCVRAASLDKLVERLSLDRDPGMTCLFFSSSFFSFFFLLCLII